MPDTRHVTSLFDLTTDEIKTVLDIAKKLKDQHAEGVREPKLAGANIALAFEKPSLRTRVSFEAGIRQLGGGCVYLGPEAGLGKREPFSDFSQVLSRYVDAIVCRSFSHETILQLAKYATCPVINGLSDQYHPCQALADMLTVMENCSGMPKKIAFVGDANNVSKSLAIVCGKLGVEIGFSAPDGYHFDQEFLDLLQQECPRVHLTSTTDPSEAASGADAIYTDVWASMGQEAEQKIRAAAFADFQVNQKLMSHATDQAIFLHCLPARRGEEVTEEVIDGPQSRIVDQAENRMHAQKALLVWLLKDTV